MTLQSAGDRLGFTKQALGHWETAHNPIDVATLWRLARLYKTTLVALLADKLSNEDLLALTRRQLDESQPADTPPTQKGAKRAGRGK